MAGDLIPPPSPAGRPDPDAGRAASGRVDAAPAPAARADELVLHVAPDGPAPPPGASRHRRRFAVVTGVLACIALAALVATGVVLGRGEPVDPAATWSAWKPTADERLVRAAEIAQHVGREYRLDDGSQLVDVEAGPLAIGDLPLTPVVRTAPEGGDIVPIYGDGILYVLNGLGQDGSIAEGEPSAERLALVQREALELALYTFRYVDDVDHVVTLLPPAPPSSAAATGSEEAAPLSEGKPVRSLLFRPGDLRARLEAPLALTFPAGPPRPATMTEQERDALTQITSRHVFNAQLVPNQAGQGFLVLNPPDDPTPAEEVLKSTIPRRPGASK